MRFRFTIRDLFWLTLVVAIGVGWWLSCCKIASMTSAQKELQIKARQFEDNRDGFRTVYLHLLGIMEELSDRPGYEELKRRLDEYNASHHGSLTLNEPARQ